MRGLACVPLAALTSFAIIALGNGASAHGMPKQKASLRIEDDKGYLVVAVPVSALADIGDADGDLTLSPEEIEESGEAIKAAFTERFSVSSENGAAPIGFMILSSPLESESADHTHAADAIVVMAGVKFVGSPTVIRIRTDLFGTAPGENSIHLRLTEGDDVQFATLSPETPEVTFDVMAKGDRDLDL